MHHAIPWPLSPGWKRLDPESCLLDPGWSQGPVSGVLDTGSRILASRFLIIASRNLHEPLWNTLGHNCAFHMCYFLGRARVHCPQACNAHVLLPGQCPCKLPTHIPIRHCIVLKTCAYVTACITCKMQMQALFASTAPSYSAVSWRSA